MRKILLILLTTFISLAILSGCGATRTEYAVLIGEEADRISKFPVADLLVIDAEYFTKEDIEKIKQAGTKKVYTYLNIGSVETFRDYYADFADDTIADYENWPEEKWMDVTSKKWQECIGNSARELAAKGVDGFFVDNTDVYYINRTDETYDAIVQILSELKCTDKDVIINGGDFFVDKYLKSEEGNTRIFDGVNQESVYTHYDFEAEKCWINAKEDIEHYEEYLSRVSGEGYAVFIIEYANDKATQGKAKEFSKLRGWTLYVSDNIELGIKEY